MGKRKRKRDTGEQKKRERKLVLEEKTVAIL